MSRCCSCQNTTTRSRPGIFSVLFKVVLLYAALVFGGGTLINTNHPVAMEVGKIMQLVTFVDPAIYWADSKGFDGLAEGLTVVSHGMPIGHH